MLFTSQTAYEIVRAVGRRFPEKSLLIVGNTWPELLAGFGTRATASDDNFETTIEQLDDVSPDVVVINDVLSELTDIWTFLRRLRRKLRPDQQCVLVQTSWYWRALADLVRRVTRRKTTKPKSWLSQIDITNVLELNGFEIVSYEQRLLFPWTVPLVTPFFNRVLTSLPLIRQLAMVRIYFLRQDSNWVDRTNPSEGPSVSIVIPAKDEKGNVARWFNEAPALGSKTELIIVEGGSTDGTYEEVEQTIREYRGPLQSKLLRQTEANGKGEAVRMGFDAATCDMLMILDADLTVAPDELEKFYVAAVEGYGDFIMGSRLVYPVEDQAMRTLNILGNKFFSLLFSWLLDRPIKDTLCGTKVLWRSDYETIRASRDTFGLLDPFGDFDLIFGAARLNLRIVEIPVRYHARTYGDTKISRFAHGWLLLKMCRFAYRYFKIG